MFFLQMVVRVHLLPRGLGVPRYQNKRKLCTDWKLKIEKLKIKTRKLEKAMYNSKKEKIEKKSYVPLEK